MGSKWGIRSFYLGGSAPVETKPNRLLEDRGTESWGHQGRELSKLIAV